VSPERPTLPDFAGSPVEAKLEASVQVLTFEPGLYSVELLTKQEVQGANGLAMPCARLDPVDNDGVSQARAFVSTLSPGDFIRPGRFPAYLRVVRGVASVLLTIYRVNGMQPAPELRVRRVSAAFAPNTRRLAEAHPSLPLQLTAHIQRTGDISVAGGEWAGEPGAGAAVEGFSVLFDAGEVQGGIEYQAMLGQDWSTPWTNVGEFCGSRGMALPLTGINFRMTGKCAERFQCRYWGGFIGRGALGPFEDGAVCNGGGPPLESLRLVITELPRPNTSAQQSATISEPAGSVPRKSRRTPTQAR
jgi:hypothetical protein